MEHKIDTLIELHRATNVELLRIAKVLEAMHSERDFLVSAAAGKKHVPISIVLMLIIALTANLILEKISSRQIDLSLELPSTKIDLKNPK